MSDLLALGKQRAYDLRLSHEQYTPPGMLTMKFYARETIWQLLGAGVEVFNHQDKISSSSWLTDKQRYDTHSALLIGIKPLKVESEADKMKQALKDFLEADLECSKSRAKVIEKAKALLEGG